MRENYTAEDTNAPFLYGVRKDHKEVREGEEPPMRPVCGAIGGGGAKFAEEVKDLQKNQFEKTTRV